MKLIDTHCHLDFPDFHADREQIIHSCLNLGIKKLIIPGVCQRDWPNVIKVYNSYSEIYPALGIHPCFTNNHDDSSIFALENILKNQPQVIAIGEAGLDFFIKDYNETRQRFFFESQIELANHLKLPLILHVRKAHDQVTSTIKNNNFTEGGIIHCYSGSSQQAKRYLDFGFKLGIGGVITYPRSTRLHKIVRDLPLESFVLETDAPDIPPLGKEKERNSPEYLVEIFQAFANLRNESTTQVEDQLFTNTIELFQKLKD